MRFLILFLLVIFVLLVQGCSILCKDQVRVEYRTVEVPVIKEIPDLPEFPPIILPFQLLPPDSNFKQKAEALVQSIKLLQLEVSIRDTVIDGLRNQP